MLKKDTSHLKCVSCFKIIFLIIGGRNCCHRFYVFIRRIIQLMIRLWRHINTVSLIQGINGIPDMIFQCSLQHQGTFSRFFVILHNRTAPAFRAKAQTNHLHLRTDILIPAVGCRKLILHIDISKLYFCAFILPDDSHLLLLFLCK